MTTITELSEQHQRALANYIDALYAFQEEKRADGVVSEETAYLLNDAAEALSDIEAAMMSKQKFKVIKGGKK